MTQVDATLGTATQVAAPSNAVTVVLVEIDLVNQRLVIPYFLKNAPNDRRVAFVAVGAGALASLKTSIQNAIQADLPGNPAVTLP